MPTPTELPLLQTMLADAAAAPELYRPTRFWQPCSDLIVAELETRGPASFRRHPSALRFFVPVFRRASPIQRQLASALGFVGEHPWQRRARVIAEREFAIVAAADKPGRPQLAAFSESEVGRPDEQFVFEGRRFSCSALRYLRMLALLKKTVDTHAVRNVLEIGGGFGTLGEILLSGDPDAFYVNVDIPPLSFVSSYYLRQVFGADAIATYDHTRELEVIDLDQLRGQGFRGAVLCAWQLPKLRGSFELFVNSVSFQEMEPRVVENYSALVQALVSDYVVLRNSVKGKTVASAADEIGVVEPVVRDDYLRFFELFERVAADGTIFGDTSTKGFVSEVTVWKKR
ncbi:putative sugar O-methyltransferase [Enhygromyxa salina]|nr:putative sugar O-methyltransferase [Enhygromyxa salina]